MKWSGVLVVISAFLLSGCIVRSYQITKDRVDQDVFSGNRGYLQGTAPAADTGSKSPTRTVNVVEIELYSPIKFEKAPQEKAIEVTPVVQEPAQAEQETWGNRGYITQSEVAEVAEPKDGIEKYTVQKGDTLQKISKKYYGTTKKWKKIFDANSANLKAANRIYPGQVIDVPVEGLKEVPANLK